MAVGIEKSLQVSFILKDTFVLLNLVAGLIIPTALLESSMWKVFSGDFLESLERLGNIT